MIINCAVSFESKKKKIPDLSLPPCIGSIQKFRYLAYTHTGPNKFCNPVLLWIRNDFFSDPDPTFQIITVPDPDPVSDSTWFFLIFLT